MTGDGLLFTDIPSLLLTPYTHQATNTAFYTYGYPQVMPPKPFPNHNFFYPWDFRVGGPFSERLLRWDLAPTITIPGA
jgi:hypothetical protein